MWQDLSNRAKVEIILDLARQTAMIAGEDALLAIQRAVLERHHRIASNALKIADAIRLGLIQQEPPKDLLYEKAEKLFLECIKPLE